MSRFYLKPSPQPSQSKGEKKKKKGEDLPVSNQRGCTASCWPSASIVYLANPQPRCKQQITLAMGNFSLTNR